MVEESRKKNPDWRVAEGHWRGESCAFSAAHSGRNEEKWFDFKKAKKGQ